jgi:N6-adenosine-specific RNA methylase IME4
MFVNFKIKAIDVASIASQRCFVFLWCGSSDGLDKGRECMRKWGFRRCEDICWIKTNKNKGNKSNKSIMTTGIFQTTKVLSKNKEIDINR